MERPLAAGGTWGPGWPAGPSPKLVHSACPHRDVCPPPPTTARALLFSPLTLVTELWGQLPASAGLCLGVPVLKTLTNCILRRGGSGLGQGGTATVQGPGVWARGAGRGGERGTCAPCQLRLPGASKRSGGWASGPVLREATSPSRLFEEALGVECGWQGRTASVCPRGPGDLTEPRS